MIYTVGLATIYEPYIASDPAAAKGAGGSVWKTRKEATRHATHGFKVYGVRAQWKRDTLWDGGEGWNSLKHDARLVQLKDPT